jgi:hypothetical protein
VFRIKGIPGPTGTIRGGVVKGPKSNLEIATGAKLEDFDFEVGLNVIGFKVNGYYSSSSRKQIKCTM